jgi:hypothetical protein
VASDGCQLVTEASRDTSRESRTIGFGAALSLAYLNAVWLTEQLQSPFRTMNIPVTPTFIEPLQGKSSKSSPDLDLSATDPSQPLSAPVLRMSVPEGTVIQSSLIMALDTAYLFHLLARDPQKVVAPGKSLLSVLSGLEQTATHSLESAPGKSVRRIVHRAFWDQVNTSVIRLLVYLCYPTLSGSRSAFFSSTVLTDQSPQGYLQRSS